MQLLKSQISLIIATLVILAFQGCFEAPELSEVPEIKYRSITFRPLDQSADSLILRFEVKDGDGNVGLGSNESNPPYHTYNIIVDALDSIVKYRIPAVAPFRTVDPLGNEELFSETDNRPAYNCLDYAIATFSDLNLNGDTIFISPNEYHHNIHVTFLKKNLATGDFTEVDFSAEFGNACSGVVFDGRIPIFDQNLLGKPLQGVFSYFMVSEGFLFVLSNETFKVRFYIYDRELNQSNIIETPEVTLQDITRN